MQILTYTKDGVGVPGLSNDSDVFDTNAVLALAGFDPITSNRSLMAMKTQDLLSLGKVATDNEDSLRTQGAVHSRQDLHLGPPIPDPEKIICIGLNYHDHAEEVGAQPPNEPIFFAKYPNSLIGWQDTIIPPRETTKVDYEAELAVVIGKPGRYISQDDALDHVAGAMVFNDVSARDLQLANQLWTGGKAIDTFGPCGPALHTIDEIADLQNLGVRAGLNGELLQNGNSSSMIFSTRYLISFLSRIMTLEPGDIIATGTPAGVAASHEPARFMKAGDTIEIEIEGLGKTSNPVGPAWR